MKYLCNIILMVLSGIIISCKSSPNQPVQTINEPPNVVIKGSDSTMKMGDTLKIILHANDATLISGSLDFKDGTAIVFSKLTPNIDTTITHIYSWDGLYSIEATFSDGYLTSKSSMSIEVKYRFISLIDSLKKYYPFQIGNVWEYEVGDEAGGLGITISYKTVRVKGETVLKDRKYFIIESSSVSYERFDSSSGNLFYFDSTSGQEYLLDSTKCNVPSLYYWGNFSIDTNAIVFGDRTTSRVFIKPGYPPDWIYHYYYAWGFGLVYSNYTGFRFRGYEKLIYAKINGREYGAHINK